MSTTGAQVIASVRRILLDPSPGDWFTDADLLECINTAQDRAASARPDLTQAVANISMAAGSIQQLDGTHIAIFDIYFNVASKAVVTLAPRSMLDNGARNWPAATQAVDVVHWVHDDRAKTVFRVYPPNDGTGVVTALVSKVPTRLTATSDVLTVNDVYKPVIDALTLAEAYAANSVKRDVEKATYYENKAMTALGLNAQAGQALAPRTGAPRGA